MVGTDFPVSSQLQLPFVWRKNGAEVGFPKYVLGCEEDGKYFCNITDATKEDEVQTRNRFLIVEHK